MLLILYVPKVGDYRDMMGVGRIMNSPETILTEPTVQLMSIPFCKCFLLAFSALAPSITLMVVWAIEPRNDTLENVIDYILRYTEDYLVASGLRLRFSSPLESPEVVVGSKVRHAFVMAYKEALNNLVKHASARTVYLGFEIASKGLVVVLGDDGCGFTAGRPGGNGLKNMSARLAEVGGRFEIGSRDDGGTVVRLSVPLDGGGGGS